MSEPETANLARSWRNISIALTIRASGSERYRLFRTAIASEQSEPS